MGLKPKDVALISAGVAVSAIIGYAVYYDYKTHHDPVLRKQKKKERKRALKEEKKAKVEKETTAKVTLEAILEAADKVPVDSTPEEVQKFFMDQVAAGEALCNQGPDHYLEAVLHFYLALKVYPAPQELIGIYQRTLPEEVLRLVVQVMMLDQHKRQNEFYSHFPPKDTHTRLGELPAGTSEEGRPIVRRSLVADKDITKDEIIYSESPLVAGLFPALEGTHCHHCLKKTEDRVHCPDCDAVVFCSQDCLNAAMEGYHKCLCVGDKGEREADEEIDYKNSALEFFELSKEKNIKYPLMIAKFLSVMIAEEMKNPKEKDPSVIGPWDHVDRFRYLETHPTPQSEAEISLLKQMLGPKIQGVTEFLTDEIYLMLKGKLLYNAYGIPLQPIDDTPPESSEEHIRVLDKEANYMGAAIYKISTYLGQSKDDPNVEVIFENDRISVRALKDIKADEELTCAYSLPVPKKTSTTTTE